MIFHHDFSRDRCRSCSIVKNQPMESTCKENIRGQDSGSAARYLYIVMFKGLILKLRIAKKKGGAGDICLNICVEAEKHLVQCSII